MSYLHWVFAISLSLFFHIGIALHYMRTSLPENDGRASAQGDYGFEIGLGMAGSYSNAISRQNTEESQRLVEQLSHEQKLKQKEKKQPRQKAKLADNLAPPSMIKRPPPKVADYQHTKAESEPAPTPEPTTRSIPATTEPAQQTQSANHSPPAAPRATGSGNQSTLGGRPGAAKTYFSSLMAWLNTHKNYPKLAKKNKEQGIVKLKFTVTREGDISNASIHNSSGYQSLDQAAMQMLRAASPVPPIPNDLGRSTLTLVIPIEYSLITNNSYKE
jgi:protein TonB